MSKSPIKLSRKLPQNPISKNSLMSPYSRNVLSQLRKCKIPKLDELSLLRSKSTEPAKKKVAATVRHPRAVYWVDGEMSLREAVNTYSSKEMLKESMRKVHRLPRRKIGRWTDHISYKLHNIFDRKQALSVMLPAINC